MQHDLDTDPFISEYDQRRSCILNDRDFFRATPALDFSGSDWLRIIEIYTIQPSVMRRLSHQSPDRQLKEISWSIEDDDPCPASFDLSKRFSALPHILRLAVLDVIERFWTSDRAGQSLEEWLGSLGVTLCDTAHSRLRALKYRQDILAELE